ncbi:MAG: hypothetical protein IJG65_01160, partial [Synergistaceae bacterium]|nr:hypothetical protein [Synergistaceae bacterium]
MAFNAVCALTYHLLGAQKCPAVFAPHAGVDEAVKISCASEIRAETPSLPAIDQITPDKVPSEFQA